MGVKCGVIIGPKALGLSSGLVYCLPQERTQNTMKNTPASKYMEDLKQTNPPESVMAAAKIHAARIDKIDSKLVGIKGERRALADWFLAEIAKQRGAK